MKINFKKITDIEQLRLEVIYSKIQPNTHFGMFVKHLGCLKTTFYSQCLAFHVRHFENPIFQFLIALQTCTQLMQILTLSGPYVIN